MIGNRSMLLVEDDDLDAKTVRRAFKELHVTNPLVRVATAEEGLEYLRDPDREPPGLILLDLNLPGIKGSEFLEIVKQDEHLRRIPVVVLTSSALEIDRVSSFNQGIAGYMIKPVDYLQFVEVMRAINVYWTLSETI